MKGPQYMSCQKKENLQHYPQAFQYCRRHPLNHLQNSCQFLSDEVLFLCTVFQLLYNAIGNLTSIQCLIFYEAGDDGNGYSSQEMILFLDEYLPLVTIDDCYSIKEHKTQSFGGWHVDKPGKTPGIRLFSCDSRRQDDKYL